MKTKWASRSIWTRGFAAVPIAIAAGIAVFAVEPVQLRPTPAAASRPVEDPSGNALRSFYRELDRAQRGKGTLRIVHYGDSHVAADLMTGVIRRNLQERFGDGGPGFVLAGKPWPGYLRPGVTSHASSGWQTDGLTETALATDGRFGLAGVSISANAAGSWVRLTATAALFEVGLLKQPRGGSVDILLDGAVKKRGLSLASTAFEPLYVPVEAALGNHTLEVRVASAGPARIFGIAVEKGGGVVYDALGINGARASRPPRWDWKVFGNALARRHPDLVVLAYGTNEADDIDLDLKDYRSRFRSMLEQFHKAAPGASLLVVGPPDRAKETNRRWKSIDRMAALVEAQRQAAFEAGAAFFDVFSAMGGNSAIDRWAQLDEPLAQPDRVHLTQQGYALEADWIFSGLMTGYANARRQK